jgi:uncharacterized membrane protein
MGMSHLNLAQQNKKRAAFLVRALALLLLAGAWNIPSNLWAQANGPSVTAAKGPSLTLTPSSVTFGTEVVGSTGGSEPVVQSVDLKNTGTDVLNISKVAVSGDFSQTNNCPAVLPAGASCAVDITFKPSGEGVRNGSLEITSNAANSPQTLVVAGTGSNFNVVHIHLLINHFPIIGTIIGLGLFLIALFGKSEDLQRASLVIFLCMALLTMPTYMSGSAALDAIRHLPGIPLGLVIQHQNAALLAYLFMEFTGLVSWFGLWEYRRNSRLGGVTLTTVLILALATVGLMGNAGNLGGKIRHGEIMYGPELAPTANAAVPALSLDATAIGMFVRETKWVWPTLQTLHFMGLTLLLGVVLLVDLRLLGVMKSVSFSTVHRLLPWGVMGFTLNVFTGMCYFLAAEYQYSLNPMFYLKIVFIMLAGVNALYLTLFEEPWAVQAGEDAPLRGKVIAASMVVLWVGVIFCGIMLPFLGNAF